MFTAITVARPYARAAFNFAIAQQNIDHWNKMLTVATIVLCDEKIKHLITRPISPAFLSKKLMRIFDDQLDYEVKNFLKVIIYNRRLSILPTILDQFMQLCSMYNNVIKVEVISSIKLNQNQITKITIAIEKHLSCHIKLHCKIDPSIIAGVILKAGDTIIDGSIQGRIKQLTNAILSQGSK
ncbi:F0F1 ATP synthase subunit delta [Candidatus Erwinia haradaeae]|uniref:ATP synthase subunit delta n=1 Tax=Candidatus Erwinia haradaeae TaxID=1922217 RepID=A0A451DJQ5_9GAMM|nr:F0F1 ATP synthase subunit delta [Candidatus Erwinia haradaeae]VFP86954.1 ATP synthase subunit delta [Candidatus Erwinia haradaeae]